MTITGPDSTVAIPNLDAETPRVTISLRYWKSKCQCLSDWQPRDLKKLTKTIDKVQGFTLEQIKNDNGLDYKSHKGPPSGSGFSRPSDLSLEIPLYELTVSEKARIHGFEQNNVFYLVWLDKDHDVFPSGR